MNGAGGGKLISTRSLVKIKKHKVKQTHTHTHTHTSRHAHAFARLVLNRRLVLQAHRYGLVGANAEKKAVRRLTEVGLPCVDSIYLPTFLCDRHAPAVVLSSSASIACA